MDTPELLPLEVVAAAKRAELSCDWPTAAKVSRAMGSPAANPNELATQLRRNGQLLGVYLVVTCPPLNRTSIRKIGAGLTLASVAV